MDGGRFMMGLVALRRDKGTEELAHPFWDPPPLSSVSLSFTKT